MVKLPPTSRLSLKTHTRDKNGKFSGLTGVLLLTLAYWLASQIGHQLSVPPSFASIIWPPAGVALAGLLLLGYRGAIAVFLGSFLPHLASIIGTGNVAAAGRASVIPLIIAAGAAVQACVGCYLNRRKNGFPNQLNDIPQIVRLLFLGGPVACVVEATIGSATLWWFDALPDGNWAESWITWWSGDCMGVFIFTPALLFWLTPNLQNRIRRGLVLTAWSVTSLSITMAAVSYTKSMQQEMLSQKFREAAHLVSDDFEEAFNRYCQPVAALQAFMTSAPRSDKDIKAFSTQLDHDLPGLMALGWLDKVAPGTPSDFNVVQTSQDDIARTIMQSLQAPSLLSDDLQHSLHLAAASGTLTSSGRIALGGSGPGLLLIAPVYSGAISPETVEERQAALQGYAVALVRLSALIDHAFHEPGTKPFQYWLFDDSQDGVRLASNQGDFTPSMRLFSFMGHAVTLGTEVNISIAQRNLRFVYLPTDYFTATNHFRGSWVILLGGFFLNGLLACFVMIATGRESALRDLVARHTAALRESEQKYRTLTETTHDWIWEVDRELQFTYVSPRIAPLLGYSSEEITGLPALELIPSGERDNVQHEFALATSERRPVAPLVIPHRHYDGHMLYLETSAVPLFGASGEFKGFRGSSRDVTLRKSAEDQLRRQYESLRLLNNLGADNHASQREQIQEALRFGARHLDLEIAILSQIEDDRFTVVQHVAPPEMNLTDGMAFPLEDTYCAMTMDIQNVVAVSSMGTSEHAGHPCYQKFKLEAYIGAPVVVQNRLIGTIGFSSPHPYGRSFDDGDIEFMRLLARWIGATIERDETLHALESALDRVEAILANTPVGIAILDQERKLRQVNQTFRTVFHIEEDEDINGKSVREFYGNDDHFERIGRTAYSLLAMGQIFRDEAVMRRRDGTSIWIRMVARMVADGPSRAVLWAIEDITEQKAADERLNEAHKRLEEQTKELARSNAELEQFAYVASHDLRQPLRQISSYVTLLERDYNAMLDDEGREFISFARSGAARMDRLIVDLLEYSRIGRKTRPMQDVALPDILEEVMFNLGQTIADAHAEVTTQFPPDLPTVYGDATELVRLFQNLIGNAIKYRPSDRTPVVNISAARSPERTITLTVADNGIGIAADQYERVFGIFQRLHGRNEYEGTGIGLAVCKKIVEHHKGRIWLDSVEGEGTRFYVTLPIGNESAS